MRLGSGLSPLGAFSLASGLAQSELPSAFGKFFERWLASFIAVSVYM